MRRYLTLLFLLPILLLQSCLIEGKEEIWIEANGAGKFRLQYTLPTRMMHSLGDPEDYIRAIRAIDEREENARLIDLSFEEVGEQSLLGGNTRFILEAEFDDILKFFELTDRNKECFISETGADPDNLESIVGNIDLKMDFLSPQVERTVSLNNMLPSTVRKFPNALGRSNFNYTYHLPFPVEETNAHKISEDRKTVQWNFLLKEHVNQPISMKLETRIPIPWWLTTIIVILALIVLRILFRLFRRK